MYYLLISPFESITNDWELAGPYTEKQALDLRNSKDLTKEHFIVSINEIAQMCRKHLDELGEFVPPKYEVDKYYGV